MDHDIHAMGEGTALYLLFPTDVRARSVPFFSVQAVLAPSTYSWRAMRGDMLHVWTTWSLRLMQDARCSITHGATQHSLSSTALPC